MPPAADAGCTRWRLLRRWLLLLAAAYLAGCAGPPSRDGPPRPRDVPPLDAIVEPVPRWEAPSRYGNPASYTVLGKTYRTLPSAAGYRARGKASWYGRKFHGQRTSSGEPFDMFALTAAHRELPLPTFARVTNLDNGRNLIVRINDRGPFHHDRILDLSWAAAAKLGVLDQGTARVEVQAITPARGGALATAPAAPARAVTDGPLWLQVGAFAAQDNAELLRQRLLLAGLGPVHVARERRGRTAMHIVRLGPYATPEALASAASRYADRAGAAGL